jgi:hypothetical protein
LTVRFGPRRAPECIRRLDGVFPLELTGSCVAWEQLTASRAGEVSALFDGLLPNLSYGIGWGCSPT